MHSNTCVVPPQAAAASEMLTPIKHLAMLPQQQSWSAPPTKQSPYILQGQAAGHLWAEEDDSKFISSSQVASTSLTEQRFHLCVIKPPRDWHTGLPKLLQKGQLINWLLHCRGNSFYSQSPMCSTAANFRGLHRFFPESILQNLSTRFGMDGCKGRCLHTSPKIVAFVNTKIKIQNSAAHTLLIGMNSWKYYN